MTVFIISGYNGYAGPYSTLEKAAADIPNVGYIVPAGIDECEIDGLRIRAFDCAGKIWEEHGKAVPSCGR